MNLRHATPADLPGIIDLLRASLGDGSTEKSAAFWRWKHEGNPFGASPVMVADDGGRIAGVRAFMRWQWQSRDRTYRALRAVDTATHPDYRGQGIFKRLTLRLIEECRQEGDDFIFNTPNEQSRPGYLKMGWQQLGKLPVRVAPLRPLAIARNLYRQIDHAVPDLGAPNHELLSDPTALQWLEGVGSASARGWWTPPSAAFLRWRYADCPARTYHVAGDPSEFIIVYYGRQQRIGTELRIVEYLVREGAERRAKVALADLRHRYGTDVMTAAPTAALPNYFLPALPIGLILTFRELNHRDPPPIREWRYTLGDLELF
ncbi:acetyltransferase (GNAT) family protein [Neolewinella xylanilytica]|uniref:Acetyltransferase (GNAT) family protein n=1 Tax=Neolewinella xylanilytica TaxID=1514080 RepID=A0A2S6I902_9BACT|nr:GNAT family N-acetyltransferase [Neolewinella xylanilytica]PPK87971.1 acetyltransferase (GNAT) family protein [Neolewinella xylanilytica]